MSEYKSENLVKNLNGGMEVLVQGLFVNITDCETTLNEGWIGKGCPDVIYNWRYLGKYGVGSLKSEVFVGS